MNVDLGIWGKLTKLIVGLVVLAAVLLIGASYVPLIQENQRMRAENLRLENELQQETAKSKQLEAQIEALRNDPKAVERLVRKELGYAKPGETVIHFEAPATNPPTR